MLIIEIRTGKKLGLEIYSVVVNGTLLNTFLSLGQAENRKKRYLIAWNIEKVGQSKRA